MRLRLPQTLLPIAAAALLVAGCDDDPVGTQGPFTFRITFATDGSTRDLLSPGQDIELEVGDRLQLHVQVLDARGVAPPVQTGTVSEEPPVGLESLGATFDDELNLARFDFRAIEAATVPLAFVNSSAGLQLTIIVRIVDPQQAG